MKERKNAILLFSKPPIPGLVKTRLSVLKDGVFTPEDAAYLYHCMLFDVTEVCCDALTDLEARERLEGPRGGFEAACPHIGGTGTVEQARGAENPSDGFYDTYDLFISTTPEKNLAVMQQLFDESGSWPRDITFICDTGASFDEHYNDAFSQVFAQGYDTILSMGADMPALTKSVIIEGFNRLHELCAFEDGGCVVSPDQEMGVSLIGWTRNTEMDHSGVFYNQDGLTVLPAYVDKTRKLGIRMLYLPAVPDVDTMADLLHNATLVEAIAHCAQYQDLTVPWRSIEALKYLGIDRVIVPPNELRDSREGIDVPANNAAPA